MASALSRVKNYSPTTKGLNSRFALPTLQDLEASVLENFQVNNSGVLETYQGYTLDGSPFPNVSDSFIRTLFNFRRGSSIDWLLIAAQDNGNTNSNFKVDIKYTPGDGTYSYIGFTVGTAAFTNGNTAVTGTSTSWASELKAGDKIKLASDTDDKYTEISVVNSNTSLTLVAGGYLGTTHVAASYIVRKIWNFAFIPRMTTFNNVAVITNGSDQPQSYDGTSLNNIVNTYSGTTQTASGSTFPLARYVITHKNRAFFANTSSRPSGLFWTRVNDQTTMDGASNEDIFAQDGGSIVSITSFADSIIVLKSNGRIYQVGGNFDDSTAGTVAFIKRLDYSEYIGAIAEQSNVVHNNNLYFMSETGIYTIDRWWLQVKKTSWIIDPDILNLQFQLTPSAAKSFPFTTKTQWDAGTHTGTFSLQAGSLDTFFDDFRQTDATQQQGLCSIAIGTDNAIHVAYVTSGSSNKGITYVRYLDDGTIEKENTGITAASAITGLSVGVSPADQTVGIIYATGEPALRIVERTPDTGGHTVMGTWGASVNLDTGSIVKPSAYNPYVVSLVYGSGGDPQVGWMGSGSGNFYSNYSFRTSGNWTTTPVASATGSTGEPVQGYQVSLVLDSSNNPYISFVVGSNKIFAVHSTNSGATWTLIENFSDGSHTPGYQTTYQGSLDHAGNYYTTYTNNGAIVKRNHSGSSTSTLDSTANSLCRGYITIYQNYQGVAPTAVLGSPINVDYYLNVAGTGTSQVERYAFEQNGATTNYLQNPTANVINKGLTTAGSTLQPGMNPMVNHGQVIATIGFGTNTNEIVIHRITFYGHWESPQETDSTLSAWGNYVVTGSTPNGGTLSYQQALASGGTATSFTNIVPPSLISTNPALNIIAARVFWTVGQWLGAASVTSIVLNYTGAGVNGAQIVGTEFFNEIYWSAAQSGQAANNLVLVQDISDAYLKVFYPVGVFARYKTILYAGSSTNGKLYKLKQGYLANGSTYDCDFQSKEDFLDSIPITKDIYQIYVAYETQTSGTFDFSYRLDPFSNASGTAWTTVTVDQTQGTIAEIPVKQGGIHSIQYRIQSTANGFTSKIIGWTLTYGISNLR